LRSKARLVQVHWCSFRSFSRQFRERPHTPTSSLLPHAPDTLVPARSRPLRSAPTSCSTRQRQQRRGEQLCRVSSRREERACWSGYGRGRAGLWLTRCIDAMML
jgi:hypothetical protein